MDNPKTAILHAFGLLTSQAHRALYHLGVEIDNGRFLRAERSARLAMQSTDPQELAKSFNSLSVASRFSLGKRNPHIDGARSSIPIEFALRAEELAEPARQAILSLHKPAAISLAGRSLIRAFEELHAFAQGHGSIHREFDASPLPKNPHIAEARLALLAPCFASIGHVWRPATAAGWTPHSESIISDVANFLRVVDSQATDERYKPVPAFNHAMSIALSQSPAPFLDALSDHFSRWNMDVPPSSILLRALSMIQTREIEAVTSSPTTPRKAASRI